MTKQSGIKLFLLSEINVLNLLSLIFQNIHNFIILFRLYSDSPKEWTNTSLFSFLYCSFCSASQDLVSYQSKTFHPIVLVEGVYDDMAIDETQRISTSHHQWSHFCSQIVNQYEVITDASGTPVQLISTITFYASISIYNLPAYSQIMKYLNTLYSCSFWISLDFHSRKSTPQKVFDFYWLQDPSLSIDEYLIQTESSELFIYSSSLSKSIFYCDRPIKLFHTLNLKYCNCSLLLSTSL